jgi:hypothetical protein
MHGVLAECAADAAATNVGDEPPYDWFDLVPLQETVVKPQQLANTV